MRKPIALLSLGAALVASSVFAACGKATTGACAESETCAPDGAAPTTEDGQAPSSGNDATIGDDGASPTADATSPGDAGEDGDGGSIVVTVDASACPGQKQCNGSCVAIDDPDYGCTATSCAACAIENATAACSQGACAVKTCDPGYAHCAATGVACETSTITTENCGSCGVSCDGGLVCADNDAGAYACTLECPASAPTNCGGSCANVTNNNQHCGTCATPCTNPANGTSTCESSSCVPTCNTNFHLCQGACYPNSDLPTADTCEISETFGVFVSSSQGVDATGSGTRAKPYKTIQAGLTAAAAAGKRLYVCAEAFAESDTLVSNVSIFGYFTCAGGTWAVGTGHATVTAPTSPAVKAASVTNVTIYGMDWIAPAQAASSGASSYGMFATSSTLSLVDVLLSAGAAGSGANGSGTGTAPSLPSQNQSPCAVGDGAAGATAPSGTPQKGTYSASGYTPVTGGEGSSGNAGDNGPPGADAGCQTPTICAGSSCEVSPTPTCGGEGATGCGGSGGAPGLGGGGGGSGIALYAWGSTIAMTGGALTGGNGGAGGTGAGGAQPLIAPTTGATGAPDVEYGCVPGKPPDGNCTSGAKADYPGGAGSTGGAGSAGGSGAAGAGGDSYAWYTGGGGVVTTSGSPTLAPGAAGQAGATPSGSASGTSAVHN